jgi:hypothetical protein
MQESSNRVRISTGKMGAVRNPNQDQSLFTACAEIDAGGLRLPSFSHWETLKPYRVGDNTKSKFSGSPKKGMEMESLHPDG